MPPPFVPAPNAALVTLEYTTPAKAYTNNFWIAASLPYGESELIQAASTFYDVWAETLDGVHPTTTYLTKIRVAAKDSSVAPVFELFPTTANQGTGAGTPLPLNACMTVTLRTGLAGKSQRGRIYHAGAVQENLASRIAFSTAATDAVSDAYEAFRLAINAGLENEGELVVCSKRTGNTWRSSAQLTPITQLVARSKVATQRLRVNS